MEVREGERELERERRRQYRLWCGVGYGQELGESDCQAWEGESVLVGRWVERVVFEADDLFQLFSASQNRLAGTGWVKQRRTLGWCRS